MNKTEIIEKHWEDFLRYAKALNTEADKADAKSKGPRHGHPFHKQITESNFWRWYSEVKLK